MESELWIIGNEYDPTLVKNVRKVLKDIGYEETDSWAGVGGSQEIMYIEYLGREGRLILENETYIGLSLQGDRGIWSIPVAKNFRGR
jgi:hypothetical protein